MNRLFTSVLILLMLGATGAMALGADAPAPTGDQGKDIEAPAPPLGWGGAIAILSGCLGAGMCAIGGGYAIALIGSKCIESIARQPEAAGTMFAPMIVSAAMVEGGMLFGIVVCMMAVLKAAA